MRALMRKDARAVVIGGGLLGIEAAYGLAKAGVKVTLLHLMDHLMERQLDPRAALLLKRAIEAKNIEVLLGADTKRVLGEDRATALELSCGRVLPADFVVCAVGIRPNTQLAHDAGIAVNGGIMVDEPTHFCFILDFIDPDAVDVELYAEATKDEDQVSHAMNRGERLAGATNAFIFNASVPTSRPVADYTPRLVPHHSGAFVPLEAHFILGMKHRPGDERRDGLRRRWQDIAFAGL